MKFVALRTLIAAPWFMKISTNILFVNVYKLTEIVVWTLTSLNHRFAYFKLLNMIQTAFFLLTTISLVKLFTYSTLTGRKLAIHYPWTHLLLLSVNDLFFLFLFITWDFLLQLLTVKLKVYLNFIIVFIPLLLYGGRSPSIWVILNQLILVIFVHLKVNRYAITLIYLSILLPNHLWHPLALRILKQLVFL